MRLFKRSFKLALPLLTAWLTMHLLTPSTSWPERGITILRTLCLDGASGCEVVKVKYQELCEWWSPTPTLLGQQLAESLRTDPRWEARGVWLSRLNDDSGNTLCTLDTSTAEAVLTLDPSQGSSAPSQSWSNPTDLKLLHRHQAELYEAQKTAKAVQVQNQAGKLFSAAATPPGKVCVQANSKTSRHLYEVDAESWDSFRVWRAQQRLADPELPTLERKQWQALLTALQRPSD